MEVEKTVRRSGDDPSLIHSAKPAAMPPPRPRRPGRAPRAPRYTAGHRRQSHTADNTQRAPARCTPTQPTTGSTTARQLPTWSGREQPAGAPASFLQSTLPKRRGLCPGCSQLHPKDEAIAGAVGARGWAGQGASPSGSRRFYFGSGRGRRREGWGRGGESQIKITLR